LESLQLDLGELDAVSLQSLWATLPRTLQHLTIEASLSQDAVLQSTPNSLPQSLRTFVLISHGDFPISFQLPVMPVDENGHVQTRTVTLAYKKCHVGFNWRAMNLENCSHLTLWTGARVSIELDSVVCSSMHHMRSFTYVADVGFRNASRLHRLLRREIDAEEVRVVYDDNRGGSVRLSVSMLPALIEHVDLLSNSLALAVDAPLPLSLKTFSASDVVFQESDVSSVAEYFENLYSLQINEKSKSHLLNFSLKLAFSWYHRHRDVQSVTLLENVLHRIDNHLQQQQQQKQPK